MKRMMKLVAFGLITAWVLVTSCSRKSEYDKLVERELASNVKQDSLFFGIRFGMNRKDFYTHCWELNKQGFFTNGAGNMSIQKRLDSGLRFPVFMNFYPKFEEGRIFQMPVDFQYANWALWNPEMSNDKLLKDVKNQLENWYGGEFIKVENKEGILSVWAKVDGNRRIRLFKESVSTVRAEFTDLLQLRELEVP